MNSTVKNPGNFWAIATLKESILWSRSNDEVWLLNPPNRYVLNHNHLEFLGDKVSAVSELASGSLYRPLHAGANLVDAKVLVERTRDRGLGDLLFMTGPLAYLNHLTGNRINLFVYTTAERQGILSGNPAIHNQTPLVGPIEYNSLSNYNYHWMSSSVTEFDEEPDQLNVYDALYRQIGVDPTTVDPRFKRPSAYLIKEDFSNLDTFFYFVYNERKIDLRKIGYYIVAPFSHGSLRSANYGGWVELIKILAAKRPVIVLGKATDRTPVTDMTAGEFMAQVYQLGPNVIPVVGDVPLRLSMAIISKAMAMVCLDSGPLYVAQSFRVPAISLWGPHHPGVRLGYDADYMELAVWQRDACRACPCYAYAGFPEAKCPNGPDQMVCEVLKAVDLNQVMTKLEKVEHRFQSKP